MAPTLTLRPGTPTTLLAPTGLQLSGELGAAGVIASGPTGLMFGPGPQFSNALFTATPERIAESAFLAPAGDTPTSAATAYAATEFRLDLAQAGPDAGAYSSKFATNGTRWEHFKGAQGNYGDGSFGTPTITDGPLNGSLTSFGTRAVFRNRWQSGLASGAGNGVQVNCPFPYDYKELYCSFIFRLYGPPGNEASFESEGTLTKILGYMSHGQTSQRNQGGSALFPETINSTPISQPTTQPMPMTGFSGDFSVQGGDAGPGDNATFPRTYIPRDGTGRISYGKTTGAWMRYEQYMRLNSAPGVYDGILTQWVNGVLIRDFRDYHWRTTGFTNGFYQWHMDPIWGGAGGASKTRDDFMEIAHAYFSGVRQ